MFELRGCTEITGDSGELDQRYRSGSEHRRKKILRHKKKYWWIPAGLIVAICSLRAWAHLGVITYLPTLLILGHHSLDAFAASIIVTIMLSSGVAGQIIGGYLSDLFGRKEMLVIGLAGTVPFFFLIFSTNELLMYLGIMVYAFFASSCYVMSVTMTQELLPGNVGFASRLTLGFSMGVGGIGAAVIGWAANVMGFLSSVLIILIIPTICCPLLALLIRYPLKSIAGRRTELRPHNLSDSPRHNHRHTLVHHNINSYSVTPPQSYQRPPRSDHRPHRSFPLS